MILDGLLNVLTLLAILVGLVLIHELGHFVMARRAGVRVHEFGIGFPPRAAVLYRGKETLYSLNWLPIGGFVRLEGEEGESADRRAFVNQSLPTRLRILVAGVVVNFVLAWVIFTLIAMLADPVANVRIGAVEARSPAERAGLVGGWAFYVPREGVQFDETGDLITAIDGQRFPVLDGVGASAEGGILRPAPLQYLADRAGQTVTLTVRHADGSEALAEATLRSRAEVGQSRGALGVRIVAMPQEDITRGPLEAAGVGMARTLEASTLILRGVGELITNLADPPVAGPIGIVGIVGDVRTELPPVFLVWLIGLLSANLAVINALPFPPMDGGRVAVALVQAASRNRVSPATERMVYLTGFVMLMALLVWVTAQDIGRLVG
ncbi:RIP metalloprotease RseP [soil metagenome]